MLFAYRPLHKLIIYLPGEPAHSGSLLGCAVSDEEKGPTRHQGRHQGQRCWILPQVSLHDPPCAIHAQVDSSR